jgi:hypothetical protein
MITIKKRLSGDGYETTCAIQVQFRKAGTTNIPVRIHSDAPFIGLLDVQEDHSFSCDVEFDLPPMAKHTDTAENPNYSYLLSFTER